MGRIGSDLPNYLYQFSLCVGRIGSDLPNYLFQFSLCVIYACYFSLKPPFCYQNRGCKIPCLFDGITPLIRCGLLVQRLILPPYSTVLRMKTAI